MKNYKIKFTVVVDEGFGRNYSCVTYSLIDAINCARWGSLLKDIKIRQHIGKLKWAKWSEHDCFCYFDLTSKKEKDCKITINVRGLPYALFGATLAQLEKYFFCIKKGKIKDDWRHSALSDCKNYSDFKKKFLTKK